MTCPRWPMRVSSSLKVIFPLAKNASMLFVQAVNLSNGREMDNERVSNFQPNSIFCSSSAASAWSLDSETRSRRFIGTESEVGRPRMKMASNTAAAALKALFPMSIVVVVKSSI